MILDSLPKMDGWKETIAMMLKIKAKTILASHQNIYLMRITCKCLAAPKQEWNIHVSTRLRHILDKVIIQLFIEKETVDLFGYEILKIIKMMLNTISVNRLLRKKHIECWILFAFDPMFDEDSKIAASNTPKRMYKTSPAVINF